MNLKAEIFAVGKWNGFEFSLEDLESIAQTFNRLGDNHQVYSLLFLEIVTLTAIFRGRHTRCCF